MTTSDVYIRRKVRTTSDVFGISCKLLALLVQSNDQYVVG